MARSRCCPSPILGIVTAALIACLPPGAAHAAGEPVLDRPAEVTDALSDLARKTDIDLGPWGDIEVGQTDSPSKRLVATSPVGTPWFVDGNPAGGANPRAAYYSPRLAGFQVGVGYTPVQAEAGDLEATASHMVEGVIRQERRFGRASLRLTASGGRARVVGTDHGTPRESWLLGGQFLLDGLTVGAGYREQVLETGVARRTWNAGLYYRGANVPDLGVRRWTLTGRLAHTRLDDAAPQDAWSTGLRYRMTSKVSLTADLGTMTQDGAPAASTLVWLGTRVVF